ncbi:hypothetical protein ACX800_22865 [Paenarthrobacter nitroguajacolicus]|uniref:hypothetical protein n=1 Tax=Micrococcaceae TaxID=1268 RepID=UPI001E424AAD|nr:hypothetical protein [Arthrobacter sp. AK01]MCD4850768.1 hypothetical protein [Arthrobacter sp. AK01]
MAQRPERRKSALGAAHPIEHQNNQAPALSSVPTQAQATEENTAGERAVTESASGPTPQAGRPQSKSGKTQPKGSFYADEDVLERIRAAWFHTPTTAAEREASFSDFLREAALDRMLKRENTYNDGKPFPVVASGKIARGRR